MPKFTISKFDNSLKSKKTTLNRQQTPIIISLHPFSSLTQTLRVNFLTKKVLNKIRECFSLSHYHLSYLYDVNLSSHLHKHFA